MLKRIHVNQHVIRGNKKSGTDDPPLRVKSSAGNFPAHRIQIDGESAVVYSPDAPLACGARVWIETRAPVTISCRGERDKSLR